MYMYDLIPIEYQCQIVVLFISRDTNFFRPYPVIWYRGVQSGPLYTMMEKGRCPSERPN